MVWVRVRVVVAWVPPVMTARYLGWPTWSRSSRSSRRVSSAISASTAVVAEAGLEGGPAAVGVLDDGVDREPGLVPVVVQLGAGAFEIYAEVVDDRGGEDRGELAGIIGEPVGVVAERGAGQRGVGEVGAGR